MSLSLQEYLAKVTAGELNPQQEALHSLKTLKEKNAEFFPFVRTHDTFIEKNLDQLVQGELKGAPIAIKDNIMVAGEISSCGSKMLENYVAPYTATCVQKLIQAGALPIGKTNMDEFAMGSSTEHSFFGPTKNPYGVNRIPGGSSGGSAVAVATGLCF
jgi:aspartyl-tRNA(Asn)/glutamyl-tRNA(Gln) amidotransferase subunit A